MTDGAADVEIRQACRKNASEMMPAVVAAIVVVATIVLAGQALAAGSTARAPEPRGVGGIRQ